MRATTRQLWDYVLQIFELFRYINMSYIWQYQPTNRVKAANIRFLLTLPKISIYTGKYDQARAVQTVQTQTQGRLRPNLYIVCMALVRSQNKTSEAMLSISFVMLRSKFFIMIGTVCSCQIVKTFKAKHFIYTKVKFTTLCPILLLFI